MSFQLKYFVEDFDLARVPFRVELFQEGFIGSAQEKALIEGNYDIEFSGPGRRDVYQPIQTTEAQVYFYDPQGVIDADLAQSQADDFLLRIKEVSDTTHRILAVATGTKTLQISGDHTAVYKAGGVFYARETPYTVASSSYDSGANRTSIVVSEAVVLALLNQQATEPLKTVFEGLCVPSPDKRSLNRFAGGATVLARCTLADLKNKPFVDSNGDFFEGEMSALEVIQACLSKIRPLELYTACNVYTPDLAASDNPLEEYYVQATDFVSSRGYPFDCEQVLTDIATAFHLEVYQSQGAWHAVRRPDKFSGNYTRFRYGSDGSAIGSEDFDPAVSLTEDEGNQYRMSTPRQPQMLAYKAVSVAFEHGEIPGLVRNGGFGIESDGSSTRNGGRGRDGGGNPPDEDRDRTRGNGGPRGGGRGWLGRSFLGEFNAPAKVDVRKSHWVYEFAGATSEIGDDEDALSGVYIHSLGPEDGMRSVAMTALGGDPGEGVHPTISLLGSVFQQEGRTIVGGSGRRLQTNVSVYVDVDGDLYESLNYPERFKAPVYYRFTLVNTEDSSKLYLTHNGNLTETATVIPFGAVINRSGEIQDFGAPAETWVSEWKRSDEIPEGTWRLEVQLFRPTQRHEYAAAEIVLKAHWSDIRCRVVDETGANVTADIRTAYTPDSRQQLVRDVSVYFGETPVLGMPGSLTLQDGTPVSDLKEGAYDDEEPTEKTLNAFLAEHLFLEQAENIDIHEAGYLRGAGRIWPHQVFELDGTRYSIGEMTYGGATRRQAGQFIRLRRFGTTPTIDALAEEGAFTGIRDGGAGAATRALIALRNDVFNRAAQNPIAVTTAVLGSGATADNPVAVTSVSAEILSAIETGDGLLMITTDGRDIQLTASANKTEADTTLEFQEITLNAPVGIGAGIYPRTAEIKSLLIQTRDAFRTSIKAGAVGTLTQAVDLDSSDVSPSLPITPATYPLKTGQEIEVIDSVSGLPQVATLAADVEVNDESISIEQLGSGETITAGQGSPVGISKGSLQSSISQNAGEIQLRVTSEQVSESVRDTVRGVGAWQALTQTGTTLSNDTNILVDPIPTALPAGASIGFLVDFIVSTPGEKPIGMIERVLDEAAEKGATTLVITEAVTLGVQPVDVYWKSVEFTETVTDEIVATESRVTVAEDSIEALTTAVSDNQSAVAGLTTRVGDAEDDIDGLKSEVVLKAVVTDGAITHMAAVQLNASAGSGAKLALIADEVAIKTAGSETVIDENGITLEAATTFANARALKWTGGKIRIWATPDELIIVNTASGAQSVNFQVVSDVAINDNKIWHAGNDGSGSGLDADRLDGSHASAFASANHNHDGVYAPANHNHDGRYVRDDAPTATAVSTVFGLDSTGTNRRITPQNLAGQINLGHLNGVNSPSPSAGEALVYSGSAWEPTGGATGEFFTSTHRITVEKGRITAITVQ